MITTHLVMFSFFEGATQTPNAPSFSGYVLHATIFGFFDGYSPADAPEQTGQTRYRGMVANPNRMMNR